MNKTSKEITKDSSKEKAPEKDEEKEPEKENNEETNENKKYPSDKNTSYKKPNVYKHFSQAKSKKHIKNFVN